MCAFSALCEVDRIPPAVAPSVDLFAHLSEVGGGADVGGAGVVSVGVAVGARVGVKAASSVEMVVIEAMAAAVSSSVVGLFMLL